MICEICGKEAGYNDALYTAKPYKMYHKSCYDKSIIESVFKSGKVFYTEKDIERFDFTKPQAEVSPQEAKEVADDFVRRIENEPRYHKSKIEVKTYRVKLDEPQEAKPTEEKPILYFRIKDYKNEYSLDKEHWYNNADMCFVENCNKTTEPPAESTEVEEIEEWSKDFGELWHYYRNVIEYSDIESIRRIVESIMTRQEKVVQTVNRLAKESKLRKETK